MPDATPMTDLDRDLLLETRKAQARLDARLPRWRARLFALHPADAMALLGTLTVDAFAKLPPDQRLAAFRCYADAILATVKETLG
jgi:hypothetical protein